MPLFDVTDHDRAIYENQIRDFVPDKIIDIHTHVWKQCFAIDGVQSDSRSVTWPAKVAAQNAAEDLLETYSLMFPGKSVTPLIFAFPDRMYDIGKSNAYTAELIQSHHLPALMLVSPEMSNGFIEDEIKKHGFRGVKVYQNFAPEYIPVAEIRIFDFLPRRQLALFDRLGCIVMLHIPRNGRIGDAVNLHQMIEIDAAYPNIKVIIAHIGRAYALEDLGDSMEMLRQTKNLLFDFSANTNAAVLTKAIDTFGPRRLLFGSDLPILRMRMRRITEGGRYINIVPKGLYGDVSADKNMRETVGEQLTFFMYEEILAIKKACESTRLSREEIHMLFYGNAAKLLAI